MRKWEMNNKKEMWDCNACMEEGRRHLGMSKMWNVGEMLVQAYTICLNVWILNNHISRYRKFFMLERGKSSNDVQHFMESVAMWSIWNDFVATGMNLKNS